MRLWCHYGSCLFFVTFFSLPHLHFPLNFVQCTYTSRPVRSFSTTKSHQGCAFFFVALGPSFLYNLMLTVFLCVKDRKLQKAQLCASVNCFPPVEDQISIGPIRPMVKRDNKQLPERSNRTNPKINLCHAWDRRSEIRPKKTPRPQKHRRNTRKKIDL